MDLNTSIGTRFRSKALKKRLTVSIFIILIIAAAILGVNYFKTKNTRGNAAQQTTAMVRRGDLNVHVSGSGPIKPSSKYALTSNVSGTLTKIYYKDGDKVNSGDLIFEIDDKDTQLQIKQLRNSIAQAQLTRDRNMKELLSGNITAPIDGEITNLQIREGDSISNNSMMMTITDKSKLKLLVSFNNTYRSKLSVGQVITVNVFDASHDELYETNGSIMTISTPSFITANGSEAYNVGVEIDNTGTISEGMIANVSINVDGSVITSKGSSTLSFLKSMTIKAASGGVVSKLIAENGQNVKQGDLLAELDNRDLELTIQTNDLKLEDLNSQLKTTEERLKDYKVYAPFDGTFTLNSIEQGNSIKQGDILGNLANYDIMEFNINIDELDISKVKVDQDAKVTIDALPETTDTPLQGKVTKIAVEGSSSNGVSVYPVTVQIEKNSELKGSMSANAEIIVIKKENVLYVPVGAVQKRNGKSYVNVLTGAENVGMTRRNRSAETAEEAETYGRSESNSEAGVNKRTESNSGAETSRRPEASNGAEARGVTEENNKTESDGRAERNRQQTEPTQIETREVKIGISTEEYIEIISGLKQGESVVVTSSSNSNSNRQRMSDGMTIPMGGAPSGGGVNFRTIQRQ